MDTDDIEAMLAAAALDPDHGGPFLLALLDTDVLVPGTAEQSGPVLRAGTKMQFATLDTVDGPVQPFFTSQERLRETQAAVPGFEERYLLLSCRAFFEITRGARLFLNPHSSYGKEFVPHEVEALLTGRPAFVAKVYDRETTVRVGIPAQVPEGLIEALAGVIAGAPGVANARFGWKVENDGGTAGYFLVIEGVGDLRAALASDLGLAMMLTDEHPLDVMYVQRGDTNPLASIEPFYEAPVKRRWWHRR